MPQRISNGKIHSLEAPELLPLHRFCLSVTLVIYFRAQPSKLLFIQSRLRVPCHHGIGSDSNKPSERDALAYLRIIES